MKTPRALFGRSVERPPFANDFDLEEDLRASERLLAILRATGELSVTERPATPLPLPASSVVSRRVDAPPEKRRPGVSVVAWTLLSLGVMTFLFGGVLLGWSYLGNRPDLWTLGLPITLAGQAALVLGLVLQMDGLWQSNKDTTQTLDQLDGQLHELRQSTTLLTTSHSSPAQSFYVHMADGASPQMLLADLKGQLDLLAVKMSQSQR